MAMIPISYEMGWLSSVVYVSALSLWALVSGHWAAWQAARVEVEQQRESADAEQDPIEDRVVRKAARGNERGGAAPPSISRRDPQRWHSRRLIHAPRRARRFFVSRNTAELESGRVGRSAVFDASADIRRTRVTSAGDCRSAR